MAQEPSFELNREKGKLRLRIAKTLRLVRRLYRAFTWDHLKTAINVFVSNAAKWLWIATCIFFVGYIVRDLSNDLVTIEPISVPKVLSESGYTAEVASRRLRDALSDYAAKAGSRMQNPSIAPRDELPNILVPKIDLSLDTVISSIRSLLHYGNRRTISGELIVRSKLAWLRLRIDGKEVHSSPSGFDIENPDGLFVAAVPAVMEKIRPYLVASTIYNIDPIQGVEKADEIISRLPASDENVGWSYILKGNYLNDQKDFIEAENVLKKAIIVDRNNWVAHNNLGNALDGQGKYDEAIVEYRRAIALEPKVAEVRTNLCGTLYANHQLIEAVLECQQALAISPRLAVTHIRLGVAFSGQGNMDGAMAALRRGVELEPNNVTAHFVLGLVLQRQGNADAAIVEYRRAIDIDPRHSYAHNYLGLLLSKQGRLDDAIDEYRSAVEADARNHEARQNLESALLSKKEKNN